MTTCQCDYNKYVAFGKLNRKERPVRSLLFALALAQHSLCPQF